MTNVPVRSEWGRHFHGLEQLGSVGDVATDAAADVRIRLTETVRDRNIMMVTGKPGTGKSFATARAVEHVTSRTPHVAVVWLEMATRVQGKALALDLLSQFSSDIPDRRTPLRELRIQMRRELAGRHRLIVLDEAQHVNLEALQLLRWLHDLGDADFAVCMVGTPSLEQRVPLELSSRVTSHVAFDTIADDDAPALLAEYHPLFVDVDADLLSRLNRVEARGEFRWWAKFLLRAHHYVPHVGGVLDADSVEIVCAQLQRGGRHQ